MIHAYVDEIMTMLMKNLNIKIPKYTAKNDPTKTLASTPDKFIEWTISDSTVKKMKKIYEAKCGGTKEAKKRLEMIDDDLPLSVTTKNLKRTRNKDEDDSDLEVLDVIVKSKKNTSGKETSKRGQKKPLPPPPPPPLAAFNTTITVKKISPAVKKNKYEGEKITIKKNVTPTKTKYEIVQPKSKKSTKCEIVYGTDSDVCNDLDMICESDDDDSPPNFTYNFKLYLQDGKELKKEEPDDKDRVEKTEECSPENNPAVENDDVKTETKEVKEESEAIQERTGDRSENPSVSTVASKEKNENPTPEEPEKSDRNLGVRDGKRPEAGEGNNSEIEKSNRDAERSCATRLTTETEAERESEPTSMDTDAEKVSAAATEGKRSEENEKDKDAESEKSKPDCTIETELDKYIKVAETERESKSKDDTQKEKPDGSVSEKTDNLFTNIENSVAEFIPPTDSSLPITDCNISQSISENYSFYNNDEYNGSNTQSDLDYVANNYYNNF